MRFFKRIKNLWKLSAIELPDGYVLPQNDKSILEKIFPSNKAKVVELEDPFDKVLRDNGIK